LYVYLLLTFTVLRFYQAFCCCHLGGKTDTALRLRV